LNYSIPLSLEVVVADFSFTELFTLILELPVQVFNLHIQTSNHVLPLTVAELELEILIIYLVLQLRARLFSLMTVALHHAELFLQIGIISADYLIIGAHLVEHVLQGSLLQINFLQLFFLLFQDDIVLSFV